MLRAMTYNVRNGGLDRRARPNRADRLDRIIAVIAAQRPDVLALQELRDCPGSRLDRLATAVGMTAHPARSWFGQPVAVLVQPTLRVLDVTPLRRPFHHAAQRVTIGTGSGPLVVVSTHLQPYSGWRRRWEAGWLAAALRSPGRGPRRRPVRPYALLMGDLNTLDPWTDHAERISRLPVAYRRRHLRRDGTTVDTRAVATLTRAGLVDVFGRVGAGAPETAPTRHGGGAEFSGMRLDYLFAGPALADRATGCRVVRGGDAEHASDHYPVVADFDVDPA